MSETLQSNGSIDDLLKTLSTATNEMGRDDRKGITIWVSSERQAKYARIQRKTRRQFYKALKELLGRAIDSVQEDAS